MSNHTFLHLSTFHFLYEYYVTKDFWEWLSPDERSVGFCVKRSNKNLFETILSVIFYFYSMFLEQVIHCVTFDTTVEVDYADESK